MALDKARGRCSAAKRRAPARKMLAFSVRAETHGWLVRLAAAAGDADAEACAGALIERLAGEDMAAHGAAHGAAEGAAERDIG